MAPPAGTIRPWRYLAAFVGIVAVLYSLVFFTGDGSARPKLGIDLEGGTRVTLTARTDTGAPPTKEQLTLARSIIDQRVNGLGVSGAEVVQDGNNLTITVPGTDGEKAKDLGQTAQLRFRTVLGAYEATPPPAPGAPAAGTPPDAPAGPADPASPRSTDPSVPGSVAPGSVAPGAPSAPAAPGPGSSAPHSAAGLAAQPPPSPAPPAPAPPTAADPQLAKDIAQAKATRQSTNPRVQQAALEQLQCTANDVLRGYDDPSKPLVACSQDGTTKYLLGPVFLEGTQIDTATSGRDPQGAGNVINVTFKPEGSRIWGEYTTANVGKQSAFVLDAQVVSAPTINEPILGGNTQISGQFSQAEAKDLAGVLQYGSLPLSFATSDAQTVSATLGLASLQAGLIAGGLGLALVFVYCLFYYRALGVLTILSLVLSGVVVYAVLILLGRAIGFTLDLAGVAGFIVAIGITADSFVIFFERLKDEVREGRSFRAAVPRGWVRARRTILSADAVSFLAAAVLYLLAVGQVKGFAFTLGMSTVLDLVVVFLVTHPLIALASQSKVLSSPTWSGLGSVSKIGAERRRAAVAAMKGA
ncbi:MAG: protein translocase subunit SecD [Pseudonocardia sp.]